VAILAVDDVWLREPRLLVPQMQPVGRVVVDRTHPLSEGLYGAWLFGRANFGRNLVNNKPVIGITGTPVIGGSGTLFSGSSQYVEVAAMSEFYLDDLTIAVRAKNTNTNNNSIFGGAADTFGNRLNAHVPYSGTVYFDYGLTSNGRISVAYTVPTDVPVNWCFIGAASYLAIYANSQLLASKTDGFEPIAVPSANLCVGAFVPSSLYYPGTIDHFYVWRRKLQPSEIIAIANDPYQFLIPA
jgi:hypothetical protein